MRAGRCSCSSHVVSEIQLTADRLVVIGRGRLTIDAPIDEIIAGSSPNTVLALVPEPADRARALRSAGGQRHDAGGLPARSVS